MLTSSLALAAVTAACLFIETNAGLQACFDILRASSRLGMVLFGGVDLFTACALHTDAGAALLYARQRLVHAAASAAIDIVDKYCLNIADQDGLLAGSQSRAHLGFTDETVHPAAGAIRQAFTPAEEQVSWQTELLPLIGLPDRGDGSGRPSELKSRLWTECSGSWPPARAAGKNT